MVKTFFRKRVLFFATLASVFALIGNSFLGEGDLLSSGRSLFVRTVLAFIGIAAITYLDIGDTAYFNGAGYIQGILLCLPLLILGIASAAISRAQSETAFLGVSKVVLFTLNMIAVGFNEEILYRGLILNNILRKWDTDKNGMARAIVWSSIIFGAAHLANMFYAPVLTVIVQAVNATAAGVLFSIVFIKCKNIWAVVTVHALVDWIALFQQACYDSGASVISIDMQPAQAILLVAVGSGIPLAVSLLYYRTFLRKG